MSLTAATVLIVDDQPEEMYGLRDVLSKGNTRCRVLEPSEVLPSDLKEADLVLVDYSLDDWLQCVPESPIATRPLDGIALAGIFRQYSDEKAPPTGYALITGQVGALGPLPEERRPHVISRLSNVEWFFEKRAPTDRNVNLINELASAISRLPPNVKQDLSTVDALVRFLDVGEDNPLYSRYCDEVLRCRPPLHHLSERSHGLVIIRWLLHRILPHTCFLLDELHLAARLRVQPESLRECLYKETALKNELAAFEYNGPLRGFEKQRWWRGGIEQWLWDRTKGRAANDEEVWNVLTSLGCQALVPVELAYPVVTVDHNLLPEPNLASFSEAIALRLDDWPDYAEPAYCTEETLDDHPEMRAFVSEQETPSAK